MSRDTSRYEKALSLLRHVINNDNDGERGNAASGFLKIWKNNGNAINFADFWQWLEEGDEFANDSEKVRGLLNKASESLKATDQNNPFTQRHDEHIKRMNAEAEYAEAKAALNDVCIFLREAEKNRVAGQEAVAKIFEEQADSLLRAHPRINAQAIEDYQKERHEALLKLFQKADVIAKITSPNARAALENEFAEIGQDYGFLIQNPDGSAATTDEFNEEYELYCQDRDAYLKGTPKAQATTSHDASQAAFADAADDDGFEPDDISQEPDDILEPEPPPVTHVDLFPVRDANGKMSAFVPADSYSAALNAYISTHAPKDSLSLSVDFVAGSLVHTTDTVSITQHNHLEGWSLTAKELAWMSSTPEATAKGVSIKTEKGNIDVGITDGLTAEIGEGSVSAQASINGSNITINKGDMTAVGTVADTKIILKSGSILASGDVERSEIALEGEGRVEVKGSTQDTEIKLSTKSTAIFRGNIFRGSVGAKSGVSFSNQSVKAQGTTFEGHIPSSPNLQPSDFQRAQNEDRRKHAPRIAQMMPELLYQAFGLGRLGEVEDYWAKIGWSPKSIELNPAEREFIKDLFCAIDKGDIETSLLSFSGNKKEKSESVSRLKNLLDSTDQESVTLLVYPYLTNKKQDTKLHSDEKDSEGKHHYRFVFISGDAVEFDDYFNLFDDDYDKGGYPKGFWDKIERENEGTIFIDVSSPKAGSKIEPERTKVADSVTPSDWMKSTDRILSSVMYYNHYYWAFDEEKDNKLEIPCKIEWEDSCSIQEAQRPLYAQVVSALKDVTAEISGDFEAIPVIRSSVFEDCIFKGLSTDFYSDGLSGVTLSKVKGRGYVEGDLSKMAYKKESQVDLTCISDVDLRASQVKGSSTLTLSKFDAGVANIQIDADEISVTESSFDVVLGYEDKISLKNGKFKKAKIKITGVKKVDFSNAEFEDCEIIISSVIDAAFNSASFASCTIKVEGEKVDFSESSVSGQGNVIDLKAKFAVFKGSTIGGSTELKGQTNSAEFKEAKIGDAITSSKDKVSYGLQSDQNVFNHAEFGNVVFLNTSRTQTQTTDWTTAKVTGRVSAAGEMAQVLYPLFGKASNMAEETAPAQQAGNKAHPSRRFALD